MGAGAKELGSGGAGERGGRGAREQVSKGVGAGEPGSRGAWEPGSRGARAWEQSSGGARELVGGENRERWELGLGVSVLISPARLLPTTRAQNRRHGRGMNAGILSRYSW